MQSCRESLELAHARTYHETKAPIFSEAPWVSGYPPKRRIAEIRVSSVRSDAHIRGKAFCTFDYDFSLKFSSPSTDKISMFRLFSACGAKRPQQVAAYTCLDSLYKTLTRLISFKNKKHKHLIGINLCGQRCRIWKLRNVPLPQAQGRHVDNNTTAARTFLDRSPNCILGILNFSTVRPKTKLLE